MRIIVAASIVFALAAVPRLPDVQQSQLPVRALTADLRITASDVPATETVTGVSHLSVAPDGMIFSADQREARVRIFDANGKFVSAFGKKGEARGEFSSRFPVRFVGLRGDSVFTHESNSVGPIHLFRRDGTYLSTPLPSRAGDLVVVAFLPGMRFLVRIGHRPPNTIAQADSHSFTITDILGNPISLLARDRTPDESITVGRTQPGVRVAGLFNQPFLFPMDAADDPSGLRAVVASQWTAWGGAPGEVKLIFTTGTATPSERILKFEARRVTVAFVDEWIRGRLDAMAQELARTGTSRAAAEAEIRSQLKVPEFLPIFNDIKLGADGAVWLKLFTPSVGPPSPIPADWVVVSPAGSIAFRVSVPAGVRVEQVSMDRMWAVQFDSGLPVIVRYRVSAGGAAGLSR